MNGELREAVEAYEERKQAVECPNGAAVEEDVGRLLISGLDLDYDEIFELKKMALVPALDAMLVGVNPLEVVFGMWVDGIVTGLILAERRARAEATDG